MYWKDARVFIEFSQNQLSDSHDKNAISTIAREYSLQITICSAGIAEITDVDKD